LTLVTEAGEIDESKLRQRRGEAVRQLRKQRDNMSQAALAAAVGTTQQNISLLEDGKHDGSPTLWLRIARTLGVNVGVLIGEPHDLEQSAS